MTGDTREVNISITVKCKCGDYMRLTGDLEGGPAEYICEDKYDCGQRVTIEFMIKN